MLKILKSIFGLGHKTDYKALMQCGAQVIDVRTKAEFQDGHIKNSINIPLQNLAVSLSKIKKDKPIITCCASGIRSSSAKSILKSMGYNQVYNGGSWMSLQNKIH